MAFSLNRVTILGNIGNEPESRFLPNGGAVCSFSVATSERWKDKNTGQQQERTEWHKVVFFGKPAEIISELAGKGRKIYVEGKLSTRKWQDQSGQDRWTTEIVGSDFILLDGNQEAAKPEPDANKASYEAQKPAPAGMDDSDIPFAYVMNCHAI